MRIAFFTVVCLHALIHLLGLVKGFEWREVKELTQPVSKPQALVWLSATILFLTFALLYLLNVRCAWLVGLPAVVISQVLIISCWPDAKAGTLPNIIILAVLVVLIGSYQFKLLVERETEALLSRNSGTANRIITENDLAALPVPVKNWIIHSGMTGKPYISGGKVTQMAELQMKPEQQNWLRATAVQYTTLHRPGFIWSVDVKMNSLLRFQGRDKFEDGKGEMMIRLNSLLSIVHERGEKIDEGTLQRYLGEMVWFPSLALSPYIEWVQLDDTSATATMHYKGTTGSGTFYFNSHHEVIRYSALRYKGNEADAGRYPWELNITGYSTFEGIKVPSVMTATWKLDHEDWTWLKMKVTSIDYNSKAPR